MRDRIGWWWRSALKACALVVFAIVGTGCHSTPEVTSYTNPVSGRRTDMVQQNLLDAPGNNREMMWLNAYRHFSDQHHYAYYLEAIYGSRQDVGYLDISAFRSLTLTIDGQEMTFNLFGEVTRDEDKGALFETARYEVPADVIHRIADAKKVTVQLKGKRGLISRHFGPENFEKFQKFVSQSDDSNL
jgi:hypothetical protein